MGNRIIYRPHRGSLSDALTEAKEFDSEQKMKEYILKEWGFGKSEPPFGIDDIVISEDCVNDERCGWRDTRYVCIERFGNEDYVKKYGSPQCIGMCATDYGR